MTSEPENWTEPAPIVFNVHGTPAPQGSKRPVRLGRGPTARIGMVESSSKVGPWRDAVRAQAALRFQADRKEPITGPVAVTLNFRLHRPASLRGNVTRPIKYPDLDKLIRATLDGLALDRKHPEFGGALANDSIVVSISASKEYGDPGCLISIHELTP